MILDKIEGKIGFKLRQGEDICEMGLGLSWRKKDLEAEGGKLYKGKKYKIENANVFPMSACQNMRSLAKKRKTPALETEMSSHLLKDAIMEAC